MAVDVRYPPPLPLDGGDDPDGPPPPPFVRERERRRRRRRWIIAGVVTGAVLLIGLPLLLIGGLLVVQVAEDGASGPEQDRPAVEEQVGPSDDDAPDGDASDEAPPPRPDPEVSEGERIDAPSTEDLDADDARIAELLLDIDASERVMMAYQRAVGDAVTGGLDPDAPEAVFDDLREGARIAIEDLEVLRTRLTASTRDGVATDVRDAYVGHLDAWADYLRAIEEDPTLLLGETTGHTIDINRTGDDFVRAVDDLVETDVDASLGRYAQAIVRRGFAGPETPQV